MNPVFARLALLASLLLTCLLPAGAGAAPTFLTGTSTSSAYPYYSAGSFSSLPVGKTLVVPVAISGTGPMSYAVTTSNPSLVAVVKTGYPVMTVNVSYSGTSGTSSTLYSFGGGSDGGNPQAGLIQASNGNLYGTTETDGSSGFGTVFQVTTSGSLNSLYSFTGGADGANPYASLLASGSDLFGVTEAGGANGLGSVFAVSTSGSFTSLYSFAGGADGANPYGALVAGETLTPVASGTNTVPLYILLGTAKNGGANGKGSIYFLTTSGSLQSLYSFTGGADGANPVAGLIEGTDANYYGTTLAGGGSGVGTVFQLMISSTTVVTSSTSAYVITTGSFQSLYSFTGQADGGSPYGGVIQVTDGNLYGATETGGTSGYGTLYRITTGGSLTTLYTFSGGNDGGNPYAPLVEGTDGFLYGATETGGSNGYGTVFRLSTSGSLTTLFSLAPATQGGNPYGALLPASNGILYGTASTSGSNGHGAIYEIPLPNTGAFTGSMRFALLRDLAPTTVGYISGFAQSGYYDGLDFFRITDLSSSGDEYIAQGGDPTETGTGSPGFSYNNEFNPALIFTGIGQLAMANAGNNSSTFAGTNGSQFFFTGGPIRSLDFGYTIFGQLLTGFDVMQKVLAVPLQSDGSSPVQPVVMNSVTVSEDDTDAVLLASATGYVPSGTLKVTATDPNGNKAVITSGTVPQLTIPLSTPEQDSINDPPIIEPEPDVTVPIHKSVSIPMRVGDLEFDYLLANAYALTYTGPTVTQTGNFAIVKPSAYAPIAAVTVGLEVYQPFVSVERSNPYDQTAVNVYLGTGQLTPKVIDLIGTPGSAVVASNAALGGTATTFGTVLSALPGVTGTAFSASINWGDGTISSGTAGGISVIPAFNLPTAFAVSGTAGHVYAQAGIYPIKVTVSNTNGGVVDYREIAVVSGGPIYAFGREFTAAGGAANSLVAAFVDKSPAATGGVYTATINWGDGSVGKGTIKAENGGYSVYGQHQYVAGSTYPVDVTVQSAENASLVGRAWSTVALTGKPTHQPPFAQSHITGQINNPGFNGLYLSEEVALVNSGNISSGPISLKFYLSPTSSVAPMSASAIQLTIGSGKAGTYNTPAIAAGGAIQGTVSEIRLPNNVSSQGKYIIMQVITSDPIGNHMDYPRSFSDPFPLLE